MTDERLPTDPHAHHDQLASLGDQPEQFEENPELKNSMLYWFPKLRDAVAPLDGIDTPDTLFVDIERINVYEVAHEADEPIPDAEMEAMAQCPARWDEHAVKRAADELGYPAFIRTDTDSAKKDMTSGSKIQSDSIDEVDATVDSLVRATSNNGGIMPRFNCLAVREWIDIDSDFEAFGSTPIGPEVRVFVRDGSVQCHHFYWSDDEIPDREAAVDDFSAAIAPLEQTVEQAMDDQLRDAADHIADAFDGYWSVDFALATDGTWYVIDAARGDDSWHPETCEHVETDETSLLEEELALDE